MLSSGSSHKNEFLAQTKAAREERLLVASKNTSAIKIQGLVRGWLARTRVRKMVELEVTQAFPEPGEGQGVKPSLEIYKVAKRFLYFVGLKNVDQFEVVLRHILSSLDSESPKTSYIGVFLNKEHSVAWIEHIKHLCSKASKVLLSLSTDQPSYNRKAAFFVLVLISFTSTSTWRILRNTALSSLAPHMSSICHTVTGYLVQTGLITNLKQLLLTGLASTKVSLSRTTLSACITLAMRPLVYTSYSEQMVSTCLLHILSIPGVVAHTATLCPDTLHTLQGEDQALLVATVKLLSQDQQLKIHFNALEGSYALCLTANLVHLVSLAPSLTSAQMVPVVTTLTHLLSSLGQYVTAKQSPLSHWHPVLGWFSVSLDKHLQSSMVVVKSQLCRLWSVECLLVLTQDLQSQAESLPAIPPPPTPSPETETNFGKKLMKQALEKTRTTYAATTSTISSPLNRLGGAASTKVALVCALYQTACRTLAQLRIDILNSLCCGDLLLKPLWIFLNSLGQTCGLKSFLELLSVNKTGSAPEFQMLILFCDTFSHLVTILDDTEFYEQDKPFSKHEYAMLGQFLNTFLYRAVWSGLLTDSSSPLFSSMLGLLSVLRRRDDRRSFTRPNHWLLKEVKLGTLLCDLERGRPVAKLVISKLPHTIPHQERVLLFRKKVHAEKTSLGILESDSASPQSTLISVHRNRIVEDGYRQLGTLATQAIKGVIRVRFVNMQGLDEAGIDQDGVFKEFLEETIKKVFDPGLNLFCTTSEERLYPSPLSHITDNHLDLFEFVGKMIGKAVYEGIVVDVPFASFFLTQVLGHDHNALYSYLDEMPSSDPELHKNLTYVKHYEGDVEDLGLTFSFDQDIMGKIVTHELIPGGRSINVTNSNRISYIHHMAHFKMHRQIQTQVAAFKNGFRSVIPPDWLSLFSGPEVQRLISGDNSPIDLKDLRRNTSYYGGFHDSHRVVAWLWEVLEKDFNDKEKSMFLKFVTSCSKPPLLGFENLEPPFSIRCVEVADDEDDGDTVGSVLRGFLALRKKDPVNRLPTASTCFNLLKLPNYQKKSTLKEKLRYAISCNTGFELS
jgi:ubiquitin-protein ligase E3 B